MTHVYEPDVPITTRDGTSLFADVWRPADGTAPSLLMRIPYGRRQTGMWGAPDRGPAVMAFVNAGYAVVLQDVRGTSASDGAFTPKVTERDDGLDTLAWLAEQPWSDGTVATFGVSYMGMTQWALATSDAPALKAVAPFFAASDWYTRLWYSPGGALSLSVVTAWTATMAALGEQRALRRGDSTDPSTLMSVGAALLDPLGLNDTTPLTDHPLLRGRPWFDEWVAHPTYDDYWAAQNWSDAIGEITVPALVIAGWYDLKVTGSVDDWVGMRTRSGSPDAREKSRLIIGPWHHEGRTGQFQDRYFGPLAAVDLSEAHVAFYDEHVRGIAPATPAPRVRIFVMGIDQWRDEPDWPLPDTRYVDHYLHGAGSANTRDGDGTLESHPPTDEAADTLRYDPRDPVPTTGGAMLPSIPGVVGPVDQHAVDGRDDVLCYTGPVLVEPVEVTGSVELTVFVSSTAVDTDITAKLVDVFPDGRALNLCDGILRLRYRDGLTRPGPLTPGEVYEVTVDLGVTSNVFRAGHRIRLDVSSSNFPRYDRNSNTGGAISSERLEDMVIADNSVFHGGLRPSRLVLPIIER